MLCIHWSPRLYANQAALRLALSTHLIDAAIGLDQPSDDGNGNEYGNALQAIDGAFTAPNVLISAPFFDSSIAIIAPRAKTLSPMLAGEKVVYVGSAITPRSLTSRFPKAVLRQVETAYDALQQLAIGQADAYVGDPASLRGYARTALFAQLEVKALLPGVAAPHAFAFSAQHATLCAAVNATLGDLSPDLRGAIARYWDNPVNAGLAAQTALSPAERQWIAANPVVRISAPVYAVPFAFENSSGNFSGIVASVLDMVSVRTGLIFEPVFATPISTMMDHVRLNTADMAALAVSSGNDTVTPFLYTRPFMFTTAAIVTRRDKPLLTDISALSGKRVALVAGQPLTNYLLARGLPQIHIDYRPGGIDALQSVASGKVDAAILYYATANYFINQYYATTLHVSGTTGPSAVPMQFAVSERTPILRDIINRALSGISDESINAVATHWSHFTPVSPLWLPQRVHILHAAWVAGAIGIAFFVWNLRLRLRIKGRRQQEALLEQRIAFLRRLIDANPNPTYVRDGHGIMVDCNQALCDAVNLPLHAILGKSQDEVPGLDDESRFKVREAFQAIQAGGEKYFKALTLRLDGRLIEGYHWAVPLSGFTENTLHPQAATHPHDNGMLAGWIDLTQLKQMEQALRQAKEDAESANRAKTLFMATISHEIRTPMNVIIGVLELLKDEPAKPSRVQRQQQAHLAYGSATALMTLLNDILEYSRAEVDQLQLTPTPESLAAQVKEVIDFFDPSATRKGVALLCCIDDNIHGALMFDAARLRQVLNNLLSNAIKFTDTGSITLSVRQNQPSASVTVGEVACVEISVADTGPGIPEDAQAHLFQPFQQVSGKIYAKYGGTGMGLAICQRIVEAMGGTIALRSRENVGTTVTVLLPLPYAPLAVGLETHTVHAPTLAFCMNLMENASVLAVDDHEANLLLLATQLSQLGIRAETAAHARDALKMLETQPFDAVITDCNMPDISGYALAELIRRRWPAMQVVGYSADASSASQQRCLGSGMVGQLIKPVTLSSLRAHLMAPRSTVHNSTGAGPAPRAGASTSPYTDITQASAPPINVFERLLRIANDDTNIALRLIDLFEEGLDNSLPQYHLAVAQGDSMKVRQYAHHNKGPAKMLGLDDFADACETLMQSGAAPDSTADDMGNAQPAKPHTTIHRDFLGALDCVKVRINGLRVELTVRLARAPGSAATADD